MSKIERLSRNELVESHLCLVRPIAERIKRKLPMFDVEDLEATGRLALIQAAATFDPDRGVPFNFYAKYRIRGGILDSIKNGPYREAQHARVPTLEEDERLSPGLMRAAVDRSPSPEDLAGAARRDEDLRRALDQLPSDERKLIEARFWHELSVQQAAETMSVSKSRAALVRRSAIAGLRATLGRRRSAGAVHNVPGRPLRPPLRETPQARQE